MLTRRRILGITALAALAARLLFFLEWLDSPYRCFHRVPGLDMETLLRMSEWGGGAGFPPIFTFHRVLIHLIWRFHGFRHSVEALFLIQSLLGVGSALLVADLALLLYRRRRAALAVGVLAACYAPFLLYESAVLQESSTLFLILAAFWMLIAARRRAFAPLRAFAAGTLLAFASLGRPVALGFALVSLPWSAVWLRRRSLPLRRLAPLAAGIALVLGGAALFNGVAGGDPDPFFKVTRYALSAAGGNDAASAGASAGEPAPLPVLAERILKGIVFSFSPAEFPENLNCRYLCGKIPLLKWLPGPFALFPFALLGMFLIFSSGAWRSRPGWLLLPLLSLIVPLAVRGPIDRYRLILIPYLMLAVPMIFALKRRREFQLAAGALFAAVCVAAAPRLPLRAADDFTWALALEAKNGGRPDAESMRHIAAAWRKAPGEVKYPVSLALRHRSRGERTSAEAVLRFAAARDGRNAPVCSYYLGVLRFETGDATGAERFLAAADPEALPGELRFKSFFMRSECAARRGDAPTAAEFARRALSLRDGSPAMREFLRRRLPASAAN